jgi:tripartite-type tricarboxylate transporter receptor subunit TctC
MCDQTTNTVPQIKSGNVRAYGVTTAQRLSSMPDMPTLAEQGLKGFDLVVWNGVFAPKGIPRAAQDKLVAALQTAVQAPAFKTRLADLGAEPVPLAKANPGSLGNLLKAEVEKWAPIIKKTGQFAD